jgi:hypothetical protein
MVIKEAPAEVSSDFGDRGEHYCCDGAGRAVYGQAEDAVNRHTEVEILRYATRR